MADLTSLIFASTAFETNLRALTGGRLLKVAFLWLPFAAVLPFMGTPLDNGLDRFVVSGISQAIAVALCMWAVLRKPTGVESEDAPLAGAAAQAVPESQAQAA